MRRPRDVSQRDWDTLETHLNTLPPDKCVALSIACRHLAPSAQLKLLTKASERAQLLLEEADTKKSTRPRRSKKAPTTATSFARKQGEEKMELDTKNQR